MWGRVFAENGQGIFFMPASFVYLPELSGKITSWVSFYLKQNSEKECR